MTDSQDIRADPVDTRNYQSVVRPFFQCRPRDLILPMVFWASLTYGAFACLAFLKFLCIGWFGSWHV